MKDLGSRINQSVMISVIIPVYNVEPYLHRCLESVLGNTYRNLQVICVDDGSPDNCGIILDELALEDSRITVIHQSNQGQSAARNAGFDIARGELIAFIDSDDLIHPRYFETMLRCMEKRDADIVVCGCHRFSEENDETIHIPEYTSISYTRLNDRTFFRHYYTRHMVWGRLYRSKYLKEVRFAPGVRIAEDTIFNLCVAARIKNPKIYETDAELYYYRMRDESIVHVSRPEWMIDIGNWYMENRNSLSSSGRWGWMPAMEVFKAVLSYRNTMRYVRGDAKQVRHADRILVQVYQDLKALGKTAFPEGLVLRVMKNRPILYRLFRILQDPTMLKWEKEERYSHTRAKINSNTVSGN